MRGVLYGKGGDNRSIAEEWEGKSSVWILLGTSGIHSLLKEISDCLVSLKEGS